MDLVQATSDWAPSVLSDLQNLLLIIDVALEELDSSDVKLPQMREDGFFEASWDVVRMVCEGFAYGPD